MKLIKSLVVFCFLLWGGQVVYAETAKQPALTNTLMSSYKLGSGDIIRITVFREPDLTLDTRLTDAGTIIFPFLGEINVSDMTVGEVKNKITQGLSGRYIIDPKVSVSVLEYRQFFVNGEVKKPGGFPYFPGLTVQKAISMAQGFTERASESSALIIHEKDPTNKPQKVEMDAPVMPGDIVIVEESFF